jgi:hypothetical protein
MIVLAIVGAAATPLSSARAEGMTKIQAITACRAELGQHAKYLEVRKCVLQKMKEGSSARNGRRSFVS